MGKTTQEKKEFIIKEFQENGIEFGLILEKLEDLQINYLYDDIVDIANVKNWTIETKEAYVKWVSKGIEWNSAQLGINRNASIMWNILRCEYEYYLKKLEKTKKEQLQ